MVIEYRLQDIDGEVSCSQFDTYPKALAKLKEWGGDWRYIVKVERVQPEYKLTVSLFSPGFGKTVIHVVRGTSHEGLSIIGKEIVEKSEALNHATVSFCITDIME